MVLCNLECPVGIKPKRKYVRISNKGNWAQFWMVHQKVKRSYVMILEFS